MVHAFRLWSRTGSITAAQSLNLIPVWQEPGLKIMKTQGGVKSGVVADPRSLLFLGVDSILKAPSPGVNVSKSDQVIGGIIPVVKKQVAPPLQAALLGYP